MNSFTRLVGELSNPLKKYEDWRSASFPLISSPIPTLTVCSLYLFICTFLGPRFMQSRKPYKLQKILVVYNFVQFAASCWLFYQFATSGWLTGEYNLKCQPMDKSSSPKALSMVNTTYWYYISKFTELFETIFFIMRKKFSQVNELHLFHHAIMPLSCWIATKYYPTGHGTFPGLANSFIHIIMYAYYFLSAFGTKFEKYLWWKKYLTILQMVQFVVILVHTLQLVFISCDFPPIFICTPSLLTVSFLLLFRRFYVRTYADSGVKHAKE